MTVRGPQLSLTVPPDHGELQRLMAGPSGLPVFPGGYNRATFGVGGWCPMAVRGHGYTVIDEAGREIIDLNNNFTSLIHGHAHPDVVAAGTQALVDGASFGLPNLAELRHAQLLLGRYDHVDQVRYANSGTEAVMAAIRLSRAHTGRDVIVLQHQAYHGLSDVALAAGGARGVPHGVANDVVTVPVNDLNSLRQIFESVGERVAAVLLDLMPNRAGLVRVDDAFAHSARELTDEYGALLIIDEVISARLGWRGYARERGADPDLLVLGKIIGGGLPVGAVLGKAAVMERFSGVTHPRVEMGGTFTGNPVTMASGAAALELLEPNEFVRLNGMGAMARSLLTQRLEGRAWDVRGEGSLLRAYCLRSDVDASSAHLQVWHAAYDRGVLVLPNGLASLSTPMDDDVVTYAVNQLADAILLVDDRLH